MRRAHRLALLMAVACAACKPEAVTPPKGTMAMADSADQVLQGFHHFVTADGVRTSEVEADSAYFFNDAQVTQLRHMKMKFFDSTGAKQAEVVADRGQYAWQKDSMVAQGSVVLTTNDGRTLKSEKLVFDNVRQEISTDVPFEYQDAKSHVFGKKLVSNRSFTNIKADQPIGSSKQGVLLPGQDEPADTAGKP